MIDFGFRKIKKVGNNTFMVTLPKSICDGSKVKIDSSFRVILFDESELIPGELSEEILKEVRELRDELNNEEKPTPKDRFVKEDDIDDLGETNIGSETL